MKHHDPLYWFPFDPREWITRSAIHGLSIPAQGVLIRLACVQWINDNIPSDLSELTKCLGGYTGEGVHEALKLFVCRQGTTKLYWPLLEAAKQEAILKSKKRRAAGKKGADVRYGSNSRQSEKLSVQERS